MSVVVIPARMASTRLPGKPLRKIAGVPMILRVAENCKKSVAGRVIVATDSQEILEACEGVEGIESTMTADDIQSGTDRVARVAKFVEDDIIINVQGDEPFIDPNLINELIKDLRDNPQVLMNTAACAFDEGEDVKDPNCVKVVLDKNGFALYFSRLPIPYDRDGSGNVTYYKHIGIYGFRKSWLIKFASLEQTTLENIEKLEQLRALENGVSIKVIKTDYKPVSVDTEEDLIKAEEIMGRNN
ncbi:3-deoxy-manno-octulosonate cytidylyltransferase [Seleniivibrio woodruffii]|uniref:3-deoxy-manno-octulosonate cytidylyltransferase n=1 Tax=Seleniivibrio woodruffii TaxID=1078050 RepID=A0A4R1KCH0_9BACT|nr:3-deoxy-manno-octulosonate cytidylyltransferase [Seleniivibrio woodruffii]TCK60859.1 3-deoxy-manno-octulosonate cytidylyltransferase (CMP-KDO synthetase) [Seleniivibrio woodruffii]TVZ36489.1 3-deoxy-manno-octulosonate cytidylyltransferase (CMP-KDO synthetase) [Seleniivibrio woodruffii]